MQESAHTNRGREVPRSAVCKVKTEERQRCNSVPVQRPEIFRFRLGSQQIGWCLPTLETVALFTQATDSCTNLLTDTPAMRFFTSYLSISKPSQVDT